MSDNASSDLESDSDKKINSLSSSTNTTHEYDGATTHDDDDDIVDKENNPTYKTSIKKHRLYSLPQRRANTSNSNYIGTTTTTNNTTIADTSPSRSLSNLKKSNSLKRKAKILLMSKKGQNSISDIEKEDDLMFNVDDDNDSLSSTIGLSQHTLTSLNATATINVTETKHDSTTVNINLKHQNTGGGVASSMSDIDPDEDILKNLLKKN
jgi:hypothetical protein